MSSIDLNQLSEQVHGEFEARTQARDRALLRARTLTRHCANAIRAVHRSEYHLADEHIAQARTLVGELKSDLAGYPDLYFAGYTQDAIKEYAEASITRALIHGDGLPMPADLGIETNTYLNGMAEVTGELRRRCLDILRKGYSEEAERLLADMDEIYTLLVTVDYPDAVTNGLRRHTDVTRGIVERTRADLTLSLREQDLKQALERVEARLGPGGKHADDPGI